MIIKRQKYAKLNLLKVNKRTVKYKTHLQTGTTFEFLGKRLSKQTQSSCSCSARFKKRLL